MVTPTGLRIRWGLPCGRHSFKKQSRKKCTCSKGFHCHALKVRYISWYKGFWYLVLQVLPSWTCWILLFFPTVRVECQCSIWRLRLHLPVKLPYKYKLNLALAVITFRFCGEMKEMHPFSSPFFPGFAHVFWIHSKLQYICRIEPGKVLMKISNSTRHRRDWCKTPVQRLFFLIGSQR